MALLAKGTEEKQFICFRHSARMDAARLLIHFYNDGGEHRDMLKVLDRSASGLNKLVIFLKKNALIERLNFQKFKPTQKALEIMQKMPLQL
jgi:hypothetical protein